MTLLALRVRAPLLLCIFPCLLAWMGCAGSLSDPAAFTSGAGDAGENVDAAGCPDIPTMFAKTCGVGGCHDATTKTEALDLASPGVASRLVGIAAVEGIGLLIDPSTPSKSVVYTKLTPTPPFGARMPLTKPLDDGTTQCVLAWVTTVAGTAPPGEDGGTSPGPDAGTTFDASGHDAEAGSDTGAVSPFSTLRMAAGQTSAVSDAQGNTWSADADFTDGLAAVEATPVTIAGTDSSVLYNGQRYGNPSFSYAYTVPNGSYTVTLKFAELYVTGPGQRVFGITINGAAVETSFDIYAAAGAMNTAVDRAYPVTVSAGTIDIDFNQGSVQFPKVDAIQIAQGSGAVDGGD